MKKLITMILLSAICAFSLNATTGASTLVVQEDPVAVEVSAGFESEYSRRGEVLADNVFTGSVNATLYGAYIALDGYYQAESAQGFESEVDLTVGYTLKNLVVDFFDFDVGVKTYAYPSSDSAIGETELTYEAFVGLTLDELIFNPSVYAYYDVKRQAATLEVAVHEDLMTGNGLPILGAITVTPRLAVGYTDINDVTPRGVNTDAAYTYAAASIDASVVVKGVKISVGPRYVTTDTDNPSFDANELSWGGRLSYRF